jgi:glyoxylate/hydroxypyruvate reductase
MREIRAADPGIDLQRPKDVSDRRDIEYAIVGRIRPGELNGYPNLKAILSMWAGVEHLLADDTLPPAIPIVRMAEPSLTRGMVEYVCCHVLNILLRTDQYAGAGWSHPQRLAPRFAPDLPVGIMGVGVLGAACARALLELGFPVNGWSRTPTSIDGVSGFAGPGELASFLAASSVVVLLLPNTLPTRNILNRETFSALPRGAAVVNAGRGELIDDDALLGALDSGHVSRAVLDVFRTEPLPGHHPFHHHERITVTPHIASITNPKTAAAVLVDNLARLTRGEPVSPLVDRERGY